ncbi:hypothetical protein DUNSADRAFT_6449 [Dunaliella salina]|uniref:Secreted protein n=1 Tax=Dunaliella salina TaxID=3046 RepID=A0ABQ7H6X3_DUNSA|nr:hypothetical protein DUNSADRAFT_6449 [Dunaliella salina]KAF5842600.1 hypothetical protein DUNSADRAFT_6449 [Dunaliella salina]|eukprot:KAF5842599.1 hypothetical protein DUNSADRAFT_6449 [Dunaliella salina]
MYDVCVCVCVCVCARARALWCTSSQVCGKKIRPAALYWLPRLLNKVSLCGALLLVCVAKKVVLLRALCVGFHAWQSLFAWCTCMCDHQAQTCIDLLRGKVNETCHALLQAVCIGWINKSVDEWMD